MVTWLLLGSLLAGVLSMEPPKDISIETIAGCAQEYQVNTEAEFRLIGTGNSPVADCSFTFKAAPVSGSTCKPGLCYMFNMYAMIASNLVTLSMTAGSTTMTYKNQTKFPHGPVCVESEDTLEVLLIQKAGYTYDEKDPGYQFYLSVFHHCSDKGQVKNTKFEDAIEHAKGYHPVEEIESRERSQFISGILLGFGLACIFLIILFIAYCYTRNSPNRGPNRSVGMPKVGGFKKKMKPNKGGAHEVEMGVGYKATDPDKGPESEVLLTSGARDPEKPPTDKVEVEEEEDTKPHKDSDKVEKDLEKGENKMDHGQPENNADDSPAPDNTHQADNATDDN